MIYISDSRWPNQQVGNRAVSTQRLIKLFGSHSGIILELMSTRSGCIWLVYYIIYLLAK